MNPRLIAAIAIAAAAPVLPPALAAQPLVSEAALGQRVAAARQRLTDAILANDAQVRASLYRADAISMPEHQPALIGTERILAYHRAMRQRLTMTRYEPAPMEVFELRDGALEFGTFTAAWSTPDGSSEQRRGKYANLWGLEPDGSLRLKADVWGYFEALPDPALFFVDLAGAEPVAARPPGDPQLAAMLTRLNQADAKAVRTRDVEAKLALLAEDAMIMPFADTPRRGMAEIRPYLTQYTANGEGITFDDVRVWNLGFEDHGDYVIEFSKFHVDWRYPGNSGTTKGGGLHLWKRQPDGTLKRLRQIGTHDHVHKRLITALILVMSAPGAIAVAQAQAVQTPDNPRSMIRLLTAGQLSPPASLADVAWLEGHWVGDMPDGPVEQFTMSTKFGHQPAFVRAIDPQGVIFYEISLIAEVGDSLCVRVKHFTPDLAGWEAQHAYIDRPLVARDATHLYFDGITYARTGPDSYVVYFLNRRGSEELDTLVVPFRRAGLR